MRQYSTLFTTLYDQPEPVGQLGDAHYSVLRASVWVPMIGRPRLSMHDFAIIWDKDHDERVIWIAEKLLEAGLLHHVLLIAERDAAVIVLIVKGTDWDDAVVVPKYEEDLRKAISKPPDDKFQVRVSYFNPKTNNLLFYTKYVDELLDGGSENMRAHTGWSLPDSDDGRSRIRGYLDGIDATWQLGSKQLEFSTGAFSNEKLKRDAKGTQAHTNRKRADNKFVPKHLLAKMDEVFAVLHESSLDETQAWLKRKIEALSGT